jgi:hypothetical protein
MKRNKGTSVLSVLGGFVLFFLACGSLFALGLFFRGCNVANRLADDAADTTVKQFAPSAMLRKYEWFKDTAAALDAKKADIDVYTARLTATEQTFGADAASWRRDVRENVAQERAEIAGIKASFNSLAAEYNAQFAKFNWSIFERFGDAPRGAREALPREVKPYVVN